MKMLIAGITLGIAIGAVAVIVVACCMNIGNISRSIDEWSNRDD